MTHLYRYIIYINYLTLTSLYATVLLLYTKLIYSTTTYLHFRVHYFNNTTPNLAILLHNFIKKSPNIASPYFNVTTLGTTARYFTKTSPYLYRHYVYNTFTLLNHQRITLSLRNLDNSKSHYFHFTNKDIHHPTSP